MGQVNELKDFTRGQLDAALMKIGQDVGMGTAEGIRAFLANELIISKPSYPWTETNGVIYLPEFVSDGTTGPQWSARLEQAGRRVSDYAKSILNSPNFKSTTGITYNIAILKGELWNDTNRTTKQIRKDAHSGKFTDGEQLTIPNPEVACWLRLLYTDDQLKQMGLTWVITMHEPINDSDGDPSLFGTHRFDAGSWLSAYYDSPGCQWVREGGFAFVASQVSSNT